MHGWATSPNHRDHRGTITDLVTGHGCVDAVTIVRTKAGAVRGNHYHAKTTQWAYVASGRMVMTDGDERLEVRAGDMVRDDPGEPHAWKAIEDTVCVVFVQGPHAGDGYESDTVRLDDPILT
jgi:quercetin dioxygenase-like cupin family protein